MYFLWREPSTLWRELISKQSSQRDARTFENVLKSEQLGRLIYFSTTKNRELHIIIYVYYFLWSNNTR